MRVAPKTEPGTMGLSPHQPTGPPPLSPHHVVNRIKCCFVSTPLQLSPRVRLISPPILLLVCLLMCPFLVVDVTAHSSGTHQHHSGPRPPIIKEHPNSMVVKKQKPVTLSCKADGEPAPVIEWYKDNELVHKSANYILLGNGDLFILKVTNHKKEKDTGVYHCVARNIHGEARSHNASIEIASIRDDFRILPKNVWAAVGDDATFECLPPRGFPEPEVRWKKDGELFATEGRFRLSGSNLVVSDIQAEDAGRYQCLAYNMGGSRESPPAQLNVRVKPYFIRRPEDVTALSNEVAEIHCKVGGDPAPKVTWRREQGKISTGRTFITDDKSIRISQVTDEDEGVYICEAENVVGQVMASASLSVHSRPNFLVEPRDVKAAVNGAARFECVATGNPRPSVFWTKEGNQILMFPDNKYGRFSVTSDGSLIISSVKKEDAGFYVCSALSVVGSSTAKAYLNISSSADTPPPLIILGPADQTLAEHTIAKLPCDADAAGTPQSSLKWLFNNSPIATNNPRINVLESGTLQIEDLQLADSGQYQCVVYSESGQSSWAAMLRVISAHITNTMFHRTPDPSTLPDAPSRPAIINVTENSVTISWRRVGREGASPITGARVEYFSPDHHSEWIRTTQTVTGDMSTIQGLKSDSRYFFIVRAQNSHGIGPPSPISYEARTLPADPLNMALSNNADDSVEARKKLDSVVVELKDVRAINSSVVRLSWEVKSGQEFVDGFYVRYRSVDPDNLVTDSLSEPAYNMVTVYNGGVSTYVLNNLPKYNIIEFFLVPFYKSVAGKPSNTRIVRTIEGIPSVPPNSIKAKPISGTSALVSWQAPSAEQVNGQLLGYKLFVQGSYTPYSVNITVNANTTSYLLRNISAESEYIIQMLAFTAKGPGPLSAPLTFIMDPLLSNDVFSEKNGFDSSNVWICVLIISLVILSLTVLLLGFLLYKKRNSILKKSSDGLSINRESKLQSSLYPSQWQYSWKTNSPNPNESKPMVASNSLKISSSSFNPSDLNAYSTVTTDEQAADYAEVSQADNNYETAYYASSNGISTDSPVAYASSSIISTKPRQAGNHAWLNQSWTMQGKHTKPTFSTLDRNGLNHLYFGDAKNKKAVEFAYDRNPQTLAVHRQQVQPLIGSSNDYEDASLFYGDSSTYSANVTQIPSSKLVGDHFKYGSLSRVGFKHSSNQQNPLISNELKASIVADSFNKKTLPYDWEPNPAFSRESPFLPRNQTSPKDTMTRNMNRAEIESSYKPFAMNRHIIANPLIERTHLNYRSPSFGEKLDQASKMKNPTASFLTLRDKAVAKSGEHSTNTLTNCDNESAYHELLP